MSDSDSEVIVNVKCQYCHKCEKVFENMEQFKLHEMQCGNEAQCPDCGKIYSKKYHMQRHWKKQHGGDGKEVPWSSARSSFDKLSPLNPVQTKSAAPTSSKSKMNSVSDEVKDLTISCVDVAKETQQMKLSQTDTKQQKSKQKDIENKITGAKRKLSIDDDSKSVTNKEGRNVSMTTVSRPESTVKSLKTKQIHSTSDSTGAKLNRKASLSKNNETNLSKSAETNSSQKESIETNSSKKVVMKANSKTVSSSKKVKQGAGPSVNETVESNFSKKSKTASSCDNVNSELKSGKTDNKTVSSSKKMKQGARSCLNDSVASRSSKKLKQGTGSNQNQTVDINSSKKVKHGTGSSQNESVEVTSSKKNNKELNSSQIESMVTKSSKKGNQETSFSKKGSMKPTSSKKGQSKTNTSRRNKLMTENQLEHDDKKDVLMPEENVGLDTSYETTDQENDDNTIMEDTSLKNESINESSFEFDRHGRSRSPSVERGLKLFIKSKIEYKYSCTLCTETCNTYSDYELHYETVHMSRSDIVESYSADITNRVSEEVTQLASRAKEKDVNHVICPVCKDRLMKRNLIMHLIRHERIPQPVSVCKECGVKFSTPGNVGRHYKTQHMDFVERHKCYRCGLEFKRRDGLRQHIANVHLDKVKNRYRIKCPICGKKKRSQYDLSRHMSVHEKKSGEQSPGIYQCQHCWKSFLNKWNLTRHLKRHKFWCRLCEQNFILKDKFLKHIAEFHGGWIAKTIRKDLVKRQDDNSVYVFPPEDPSEDSCDEEEISEPGTDEQVIQPILKKDHGRKIISTEGKLKTGVCKNKLKKSKGYAFSTSYKLRKQFQNKKKFKLSSMPQKNSKKEDVSGTSSEIQNISQTDVGITNYDDKIQESKVFKKEGVLIKPYACFICDNRYTSLRNLKRHFLRYHPESQLPTKINTNKQSPIEKKLVYCVYCCAGCLDYVDLQSHCKKKHKDKRRIYKRIVNSSLKVTATATSSNTATTTSSSTENKNLSTSASTNDITNRVKNATMLNTSLKMKKSSPNVASSCTIADKHSPSGNNVTNNLTDAEKRPIKSSTSGKKKNTIDGSTKKRVSMDASSSSMGEKCSISMENTNNLPDGKQETTTFKELKILIKKYTPTPPVKECLTNEDMDIGGYPIEECPTDEGMNTSASPVEQCPNNEDLDTCAPPVDNMDTSEVEHHITPVNKVQAAPLKGSIKDSLHERLHIPLSGPQSAVKKTNYDFQNFKITLQPSNQRVVCRLPDNVDGEVKAKPGSEISEPPVTTNKDSKLSKIPGEMDEKSTKQSSTKISETPVNTDKGGKKIKKKKITRLSVNNDEEKQQVSVNIDKGVKKHTGKKITKLPVNNDEKKQSININEVKRPLDTEMPESVKEKEKSGESVKEKEKSGESVKEKEKSGESVKEKEKSGESVKEKEKSGESVKEKEKSGESVKEKEKTGESVKEKEKTEESVKEKEKSEKNQTCKTKEKSKHKRRSDIETHVMEPLGTQPEDVQPVRSLGKSCVSINSPKTSRQQPKPQKEDEILQKVVSQDPKMSKISRESLTKRFERSQSHPENKKDLDKNEGEKSVDMNLDQESDIADTDEQICTQQSENKLKAPKMKKSPKVLLERLPALSEMETTVNINDLQESLHKKLNNKSISIIENNTDIDNNPDDESCESADEDEGASAIIVQKLADLKKIINTRRSKRFGGLKSPKKLKQSDKKSCKYESDKDSSARIGPESNAKENSTDSVENDTNKNVLVAKTFEQSVENDTNQNELSNKKSEQKSLGDVDIDQVKSLPVTEISQKPHCEKVIDDIHDNAVSTEMDISVVGSSDNLGVVKDDGEMDMCAPNCGEELNISNSDHQKNQDGDLNTVSPAETKRKRGRPRRKSKMCRQSLSEADSRVQNEKSIEKPMQEKYRKEANEKESEVSDKMEKDVIKENENIMDTAKNDINDGKVVKDTIKASGNVDEEIDTTGNVDERVDTAGNVDERVDTIGNVDERVDTAGNVVDGTSVTAKTVEHSIDERIDTSATVDDTMDTTEKSVDSGTNIDTTITSDERIETVESTGNNNKQIRDESMIDKTIDERGDSEEKDMSDSKEDRDEGKGNLNKGNESHDVGGKNLNIDSENAGNQNDQEMDNSNIPTVPCNEAIVYDNSGLKGQKVKKGRKEKNQRKPLLRRLPSVKKRESLPRSKRQTVNVSYNDFLIDNNQNIMADIASNDDSALDRQNITTKIANNESIQNEAAKMNYSKNDKLSTDIEMAPSEKEQTSMESPLQDVTTESVENDVNFSTASEGNKSDLSENVTVLPENDDNKLSNNETNKDNQEIGTMEKTDDLQENSVQIKLNVSSMDTSSNLEENSTQNSEQDHLEENSTQNSEEGNLQKKSMQNSEQDNLEQNTTRISKQKNLQELSVQNSEQDNLQKKLVQHSEQDNLEENSIQNSEMDNLQDLAIQNSELDNLQEPSVQNSEQNTSRENSNIEITNKTKENDFSEKEGFKILKLNRNPWFSDKKLVPVQDEGQDESENIAAYPKIIRYVNENSEKPKENGLSSCNALDEIMPNMLKLLAKDRNGDLDLNGVFDDITVETTEDCYEIDYAPTERTKHFLSLEHLLGERINPCYICDSCDELFQCFEKYDNHKKNNGCFSIIQSNTWTNSSFSDHAIDSLLDKNIDLDKKYECHICGLKYKLKTSLANHMKKTHQIKETRNDKLEQLKIKIHNLNKTIDNEKKKVLSPSSQSSEITDGEFCSISESDSLVQYFAEPISSCQNSDNRKLDGTEMETEQMVNADSTLVNLSVQSEKDLSSSLSIMNGHSSHDILTSSTMESSGPLAHNTSSTKDGHSGYNTSTSCTMESSEPSTHNTSSTINNEIPSTNNSENERLLLQANDSVDTTAECDTINRNDETCFTSDTDVTLAGSKINDSMLNQSVEEESHTLNSSQDSTLKDDDLPVAETPKQSSKITNKHLESTPIDKDLEKTPELNLFEEDDLVHSPSRKLDFYEEEGEEKIFTLEEIKLKYQILLECKVLLENISLEGEMVRVGDLTLKKVGKCRWKITSNSENRTDHSDTMNSIDQNNPVVMATDDFDVNCPTYEIEYFPTSSQLDSDDLPQTNQSSDFLSQSDNITTIYSKQKSKNRSESDCSSVHSNQNEMRKQKVKKLKEKKMEANSLQLSPKKNLTEFEKAISKPKEARKKRKLERPSSKLEDSNSHDGLDFLKKANERTASTSEKDSYCFSSKLAQSIINKKAKEKVQETLNITPCALEDIEPFETVLASKDSIKKSPVKKKKKTDTHNSDQLIISKTIKQSVSNSNTPSYCEETFSNTGEIITETVYEEITVGEDDPDYMYPSNYETSEIGAIDISSSLFSKPDDMPSKSKQKSLSERFGALERSKSGDKPANKDLKNLSSGDVMKTMFGTGSAKFDRTFRKQPGEENPETCMKLVSPLESVNRNVSTKFGARLASSDMKQTLVISTEKKQPPNTKRHLLNMLKDLMDSPEEKRLSGNVSLTSPKSTGIFSDTRTVKTVITTPKPVVAPTLRELSPAKSIQLSNHSDKSSVKSDLSVNTLNISGKNIVPPASKVVAEKQDVHNDNKSDISRASTSSLCSSGIRFGRKRNGSETGSQPRKKPKIQRMPVEDDKISEKSSVSHKEEMKSNASSTKECKIVYLPMSVNSAKVQSTIQSGEEKEMKPCEEELETQEAEMDTMETDHISNHESDELQHENLISELEPETMSSKNTSVAYNSTFNFPNVKRTKLNIALSPITSQGLEEVSDAENENDFENLNNQVNDVKRISENNERSNMSVEDISDGEIEDSDNENEKMHDENEESDDDQKSENEIDESDDENQKSVSENEESDNDEEESDDENQKSISEDEESDNVSDDEIQKSDDESKESDDESDKEDKSDSDESSSEDEEVCNDKEDEVDENKSEEEDIFSTKKFKPFRSGMSDYFDDDAISIIDPEYETASFLIAAPDEEVERMKAVDKELSLINGVDSMKCDEEIMPKPDTPTEAKNDGQNSNMADITPEQQWFSGYKGPYPPGYCFRFLNQKGCQKFGCSFKHHIPSPAECYRSCVKGIAEACVKCDAKRAFDTYNSLLQTKEGLTPRETLSQLLKVAENNWNVLAAFSLLDDLNQQKMVTAEVCEVLIRLCGQRPAYFSQQLWKLFDIILKSQRIHLTADSISVLLRSFSHLPDLTYLWQVIVHAKKCKIRAVPADLLCNVLSNSLANPDPYYQHMEKWVQLCEPHLLQQLNQELRSGLIHLFHNRRQTGCERKLEESARYANFEQSFNDCNEHQANSYQGSPVVLQDSMKTTDNYKALYHKIQSCYHTKNWELLGETFVELCQQGDLNNSYYIDAYAVVFLTNVKNPTLLVDAFNKFMNSLSRQYQEESQEDVLAKFDGRSLAYIGNRLLYHCRDKKWWKEGHSLMKIMLKYSVPFYRHTEEGKDQSSVIAVNICLNAKDIIMAYSIHTNFAWDTQTLTGLTELKYEITVLHDLFDQLLQYPKAREALRVLGSCLDIIDSNPELNDHFDFIEDFNRLIISALDCGDFHAGCWAFKLHSSAQVSKDLDRRTLRCLLTACGENDYIKEAKELHKICKTKGVYPVQNIESPRTIYLTSAMTYVEIKLEIESYFDWVYRFLCGIQLDGHILDISHFFIHVNIERVIDPVAFKMPYLCRVPRSETAAYNMVLQLIKDEFGIDGKISFDSNAWFIFLKVEQVRKHMEKLDSQGLRQGFRVRGYNRT